MSLDFDIISRILDFLHYNFDSLAKCSLVNTQFNEAASKLLYTQVAVSPGPETLEVLNLRAEETIPGSFNFFSALRSRNAGHVRVLEISGYTSLNAPPRNTLPTRITQAIETFVGLRKIQFTPETYHSDLFTTAIPALRSLTCLVELEVNHSCLDATRARLLVDAELRGLRKLAIESPSRAILSLLPEWLAHLTDTLVELALKNNCGSVTPGVLKAILPHTAPNIRAITLGLSYSLTNDDVFSFLGQLRKLERLQLHYYWQLTPPTVRLRLKSLRTFSVTSPPHLTEDYAFNQDKWIRLVIQEAPNLEELRLKDEHCESLVESSFSRKPLVEHLCAKHADIRVLLLQNAFIGEGELTTILSTCGQLEMLAASVGGNCLDILLSAKDGLPFLHTVNFWVCNVSPECPARDLSAVEALMKGGLKSLRRLSVRNQLWKADWEQENGRPVLVVREGETLRPPWSKRRIESTKYTIVPDEVMYS